MNESQWEEKLRGFLKKTGDDLKRAGADIRGEAERLMKEVKDPERQDKVKKGLETFKLWARKTAEEVATVVDSGLKKAEGAMRSAVDAPAGVNPDTPVTGPAPSQSETNEPLKAEPLRHDTPVDTPAVEAAPPEPAPKTIGADKKKKKAPAKKAASKKTLGKKRTP